MTSVNSQRRTATTALLSLAIGSFGIGMTEFVIMGLLPNIAQDLLPDLWATNPDQALANAGHLVSFYALGVVVGAPTIAGALSKYPRHRVMVGLAAALLLFNGLTLLAPNYELVAVSRFLAGLPHGAYFGIGALVAARVLGPGKRAQGVAFVLTGLTVANIVGVPLGTYLGQVFGWRAAYLMVVAIFAVAAVCIARFVPDQPGEAGRSLWSELSVFKIGQVWATIITGAIGFGGFFAVYSYIAPIVTDVAGSPQWAVPVVLVLMGVGMTVGNLLGGRLADAHLRLTLLCGFLLLAWVLLSMALTADRIVPLAILGFGVGVGSSILGPAIQTRLMDVAEDNQSIAAALNHSALNVGNSLGAFLGGYAIASGGGLVSPVWVALGLTLIGLVLVFVLFREPRQAELPEPSLVNH
ncbi:MFS transporter [Naumannella halotolerans]|uniref:MFS transporter n=1 Tax=Naumannella halotolerans TaxID=993414 RepID=UPI00370D38CE